jgi:hypothetical protein
MPRAAPDCVAAQPAVSSVIAGAISAEQVTANARGGDWVRISHDLRALAALTRWECQTVVAGASGRTRGNVGVHVAFPRPAVAVNIGRSVFV